MPEKTYRTRNDITGAKSTISHHCSECHGPIKQRCRRDLHVAHCEACGDRFHVISPRGCYDHPYHDGYNLEIKQQRAKHPNYVPYDIILSEKKEEERLLQEKQDQEVKEEELRATRTFDTDWKKVEEEMRRIKVAESDDKRDVEEDKDEEGKKKKKKKKGKTRQALTLKEYQITRRKGI